ncbi:MAG: hypothetical protein WD877_02100 [Candidatus Saccharimonadales bacterium]
MKHKRHFNKGFTAIHSLLILVVVGVIGYAGWYVWDNRENDREIPSVGEQEINSGWNTTVESGQKRFSIIFPDGWGEILKPLDSDWFLINGDKQPTIEIGKPVKITELEGYGGDSLTLFSVLVYDNFAKPRGTAEDYTLTNGKDNPIEGKKYVYIHDKDSLEGIGYQRFKGDRDYEYIFPLGGGEELRISYSVYGADPRNSLKTVEAIIETIRLKN